MPEAAPAARAAMAARLSAIAAREGYEVLGAYANSQTKILFRHRNESCRNFEFPMTPNKFMTGRRCPRCGGVERYTTESFQEHIFLGTGGAWRLAGPYGGVSAKTKFACCACGREYALQPKNFMRPVEEKLPCPCGNPFPTPSSFAHPRGQVSRRKLGQEEVQSKIDAVFGPGEYTLLGSYSNMRTPVEVRHERCGEASLKRVDSLIHHRHGCLKCSGLEAVSASRAAELVAASGTHVLVSGDVSNNKTKVTLRHLESGRDYEVTLKDFLNKGHRGHHTSGPEMELIDFVNSLLPEGEKALLRSRSVIPPREIDVFVESARVGIEYNGSYYHSERMKGRLYHFEKSLAARRAGVRLIQVADSDWLHRRPIAESKLAHIFGRTAERISARSCELVEADGEDASEFFAACHLQGPPRGACRTVGLADAEGLVAAAAIGFGSKLGWSPEGSEIEVVRYATRLGTSVRGGYSRVVSAIRRLYPDSALVTFADLMWSEGALYRETGWEEVGAAAPSYVYVHAPSARRFHRTSFTKEKIKERFPAIFDEGKTERQMMEMTNYVRVYDAGKLKFRLPAAVAAVAAEAIDA